MDYGSRQAVNAKAQNLEKGQITRKFYSKRPENRGNSFVLMLSTIRFVQNSVSKNRRSNLKWKAFCGKTASPSMFFTHFLGSLKETSYLCSVK